MVYYFPIADRTNYSNSGLKTTQVYYLNSSDGQTIKVSHTGVTQGVPFGVFRGESIPLYYPDSRSCLDSVACGAFFHLQSQWIPLTSFLSCLCFHIYDSSLSPSCLPLIRTFMITWATQIIQDCLPISKFLTPLDLQSPFYPVEYIFIHRF